MKESLKQICRNSLWSLAAILIFSMAFASFTPAHAAKKSEAQSMVDKSKATLVDVTNDNYFPWLNRYLKDARGVIIFPQIIKGGFVFGGSGGTGVFLVRDETTGSWSYPAFYTLGSVTFGLQIGGEAAEVIMLAMSKKAVNTLLSSSVKLGGDVSIAVGPVGGGAKGSVAVPEVTADFISFTRTKGLYAGLNLEGSVLVIRDGLNEAYYGDGTLPIDIIIKKQTGNPGADDLRAALQNAAAK